jgi:hypothetical protein
MEVRKQGAWRTIRTAEAYVGGSWRTLKYGEAYIGGSWRTIVSFIQPLSLNISPAAPGGEAASSTVTTTNYVVATPTGGASPFTYAWTRLSMSGATTFTANSPTSASTKFTATGVADGAIATATFRCTATDYLGTTATDDVTIGLQNTTGTTTGG